MKKSESNPITIGVTAVASVAATIFIRNFISGEKKIKHSIEQLYTVEDLQFARSMGQLLGPPIVDGNQVDALQNGIEIFPAMIGAIMGAKKTITFETFIYWSGTIAQTFAEALSDRARAGVKVHVLLDGVGCNCINGESVKLMKEAGVEFQIYHLRNFSKMNNRTHRKLLVVDGTIGFTGGVGIGDVWDGNADSPSHWRDSHYRVSGPVVSQMQAAFMDNWMKTQAKVLHGEEYFPALEPTGKNRCQVFKSSPEEGSESARLMYLLSIASAEKSIRLETSYFVPDDLTIDTMIEATQRGVDIEVIVPGDQTDNPLVRRASRSRWGRLLENGVRIYEFQPTMFHMKVMIVDEAWTSVGSTNFDNRSFRLNDEANLNILDKDFASEQVRVFEQDKLQSREYNLKAWNSRPMTKKLLDTVVSLGRSQL